MIKLKCVAFLLLSLSVASCGPDTIFLRPGLDTPEQHVIAGRQLLDGGKLEDACREFRRAKELEPRFVKAYVGMGIALALKGEMKAGFEAMDQAKQLADRPEDLLEVRKGYERLEKIKRKALTP